MAESMEVQTSVNDPDFNELDNGFKCLLDVPDPPFNTDKPLLYCTHEEHAIEIPQTLYQNSDFLKGLLARERNSVFVDHICAKKELLEFIIAIKTDRFALHTHFVFCAQLCDCLEVKENVLRRLIPFSFINVNNALANCYLIYILLGSRYKTLARHICKHQLGFKVKERHVISYSYFKRAMKAKL